MSGGNMNKENPTCSWEKARWGIVGGGIMGMVLAHRLAQKGCSVTLYEAGPNLGGLAGSSILGDVTWDRYYHVILLSDTRVRSLLRELGIEKEINWVETRTGFYTDGQLYSMSNTMEFLRFPPLSILDKLRLAWTIFYASRIRDWKKLEGIPVASWLKRWSGKRTFEKIWLPLLRAKLGDRYKSTSAAFIWATIDRMYAARRTGLKKEMFGYVTGGYSRIVERFEEVLRGEGVHVMVNHAARSVALNYDNRLRIAFRNEAEESFDRVIVTVPAPLAARICQGLTQHERTVLSNVEYLGIVCASILLKKPLAGYYITNITESWAPFTAVIEMSALVDSRHLGGHSLVYLPKYVSTDDALFQMSDASLQELFLEALCRMYPRFNRSDVVRFQVNRDRHVFALPSLDYSEKAPRISTSMPGLHVVSSARIVNGTSNVNQTIHLAESALDEVLPRTTAESGSTCAVGFRDPRCEIQEARGERARTDPSASRIPQPTNKPLCSVSLDLDNQWSYMKTHGDAGWEEYPSYLDILAPLVLDSLDRLGMKITFFAVGQDAALEKNREALSEIVRRGHEVGNHSFSHEPWLHLFDRNRIEYEVKRTEELVGVATGQKPVGFRGPGFSCSPALLDVLSENGYLFDASVLPTYVGPLARAYYFRTAKLSDEQKQERATLFGGLSEGLKPCKPFYWQLDAGVRMLEIPVTTIPIVKLPFHLSYLIYLGRRSKALMSRYMDTAIKMCRLSGTEPSFLLHPLDLLNGEQVPELRFFPGMDLPGGKKMEYFELALEKLARHFQLVTMNTHARAVMSRGCIRLYNSTA